MHKIYPEKIRSVTNGIDHREWVHFANPKLSSLYSDTMGSNSWLFNTELIKPLLEHKLKKSFQKKWSAIKQENKNVLVSWIKESLSIDLNPFAMFDVMTGSINENNRQLMHILFIANRYLELKEMNKDERNRVTPRVVIYAGKSGESDFNSECITRLMMAIMNTINKDLDIGHILKIVLISNYSEFLAKKLVPAVDISEHISVAGSEPYSTSSIMFSMNGGLIVGTHDGVNLELQNEAGSDNIFIFGAQARDVEDYRIEIQNNKKKTGVCKSLKKIIDAIVNGRFGSCSFMNHYFESIQRTNDHFAIDLDFDIFLGIQKKVEKSYESQNQWICKSIQSTIGASTFTSDKTAMKYANEIWRLSPLLVEK